MPGLAVPHPLSSRGPALHGLFDALARLDGIGAVDVLRHHPAVASSSPGWPSLAPARKRTSSAGPGAACRGTRSGCSCWLTTKTRLTSDPSNRARTPDVTANDRAWLPRSGTRVFLPYTRPLPLGPCLTGSNARLPAQQSKRQLALQSKLEALRVYRYSQLAERSTRRAL